MNERETELRNAQRDIEVAATRLASGDRISTWRLQHQGHAVETTGGGFNAVVLACRTCNESISIGLRRCDGL